MGAFLKTIISYLWSLVPLNSLGNNGSCDQLLLGSGPQIDWQSESLQKHAFKKGGGGGGGGGGGYGYFKWTTDFPWLNSQLCKDWAGRE